MELLEIVKKAVTALEDKKAEDITVIEISEVSLEQLSGITESYLTTQLERGFSTLDFYKSLYI